MKNVTEPTEAICTICAGAESPGFYTGCLQTDGHDISPWQCNGSGKLTRISEDVLDQQDNISLLDLEREERFASARRMPTDD